MNRNPVSKEKLMLRLQSVSFALYDLMLYLDTHPADAAALSKYNALNAERQTLLAEYTSLYGAVNPDIINEGKWDWTSTPWPWQEV